MASTTKVELRSVDAVAFTLIAGKNEAAAAEAGGNARNLSIQIARTTGTTQTAAVQVSNDGATWVQAHSTRSVIASGDGGNVALTGLTTASLHNILERARFVRILVSNEANGASDEFTATLFIAR